MPKASEVLREGIQQGLHFGAQLYVSLNGKTIADLALGEVLSGVPMQPSTMLPWMSASKPVAAIAIGQLLERDLLRLDDEVGRFIPEFSQRGKESVTIRHLLTHTGGLRTADVIEATLDWDETIDLICRAQLDPGARPGQQAAYHRSGSWFLLGEMIRRLDGRPYEYYVREEIFEPLGMKDSWVGMPAERWRAYKDRIGQMHGGSAGRLSPDPTLDSLEAGQRCRPGSSGRGPIRELARLYEYLLEARKDGPSSHPLLLRPATVRDFTRRHRVGMFDQTFQHVLDTGLGFILDSNCHGRDTVPYGYGWHASEETFGHSGSQCSCSFADPQHRLVVAWVCNGRPGEARHQRRARAINNAVYEDLQLASR